jgi:hypothetical protein
MADPDPAAIYRDDKEFMRVLKEATLVTYTFGSPRCGAPSFSKVVCSC